MSALYPNCAIAEIKKTSICIIQIVECAKIFSREFGGEFLALIKYRDPIHGFIELKPLENKIVNSAPFQRLRNIKQLAFTYLVYHGAEHTRFGHSLGVMHLVSKSFISVISKCKDFLSLEKRDWYEQILRIIALTHDLGHAPFSHAAESVFPDIMRHEDFTESIIKETNISDIILEIGQYYVNKYGQNYNITPELICNIYNGKEAGENSEFVFLKSFMDSEIDCDKMDYLLRDSLYCGVNYGKYDIERLISCLTIYIQDGIPRLAIEHGGVHAFEEFVLARYFMFTQVYFHKTRRYFDIIYSKALSQILPGGKFPKDTNEYLDWDDNRLLQIIKSKTKEIYECYLIANRIVYSTICESIPHPQRADKQLFEFGKRLIYDRFGSENFIEDYSADKMPHKIPIKVDVENEMAIVIVSDTDKNNVSTISDESIIISSLTEKINIERLYVRNDMKEICLAFKHEKGIM